MTSEDYIKRSDDEKKKFDLYFPKPDGSPPKELSINLPQGKGAFKSSKLDYPIIKNQIEYMNREKINLKDLELGPNTSIVMKLLSSLNLFAVSTQKTPSVAINPVTFLFFSFFELSLKIYLLWTQF